MASLLLMLLTGSLSVGLSQFSQPALRPLATPRCSFERKEITNVQDGNLLGVALIPQRDYALTMVVYPRALVQNSRTELVNIMPTTQESGMETPSIGFLRNSTRLYVNLVQTGMEGRQQVATIIASKALQIRSWSQVQVTMSSNRMELIVRSSVDPMFSFINQVYVPFSRNLVNAGSLYASSTRTSASNAWIATVSVCSGTIDVPATNTPSTAPSNVPKLTPSPTLPAPTEVPTSVPTSATTAFVPSPTSFPTRGGFD